MNVKTPNGVVLSIEVNGNMDKDEFLKKMTEHFDAFTPENINTTRNKCMTWKANFLREVIRYHITSSDVDFAYTKVTKYKREKKNKRLKKWQSTLDERKNRMQKQLNILLNFVAKNPPPPELASILNTRQDIENLLAKIPGFLKKS